MKFEEIKIPQIRIPEFIKNNPLYQYLMQNQLAALFINISLMVVLILVFVLGFFTVYLPVTTNHGETITVPDLTGMSLKDVEEFLDERDLRYVVSDSSYDPKKPALTILDQDPKAKSKVKINRRIHLTIRSVNPPKELVPNIYYNQVKQADLLIESHGFRRGKITYVPDVGKNTVLKVFINNKHVNREELEKGFYLEKGSIIALEVGNGLGENEIELSDFTGKPLVEVEIYLRGVGLGIGSIIYENDPNKEVGTIIKQSPAYEKGKTIKVGDIVDLWVVGYVPPEETTEEGNDN